MRDEPGAIHPSIQGYWVFLRESLINSAKREYFIEFEVIEKLEREIITEGVLQGSPHSSFYPVIGRDTTTGYISKIYLDRWEDHVLAKEGNVMRLTIGKEKL